jgi:hypothetical protein
MNEETSFACPTCGAEYKLVRVEAPITGDEGPVGLHELRRSIAGARRPFCPQILPGRRVATLPFAAAQMASETRRLIG